MLAKKNHNWFTPWFIDVFTFSLSLSLALIFVFVNLLNINCSGYALISDIGLSWQEIEVCVMHRKQTSFFFFTMIGFSSKPEMIDFFWLEIHLSPSAFQSFSRPSFVFIYRPPSIHLSLHLYSYPCVSHLLISVYVLLSHQSFISITTIWFIECSGQRSYWT